MAFQSLSIGYSALLAAQYGLQVTGQNISNVDTAGYSRQRVNQSAVSHLRGMGNSGIVGSGVSVNTIERVASAQAEKQLRKAYSGYSNSTEMGTAYTKLQSFFSELANTKDLTQGIALSDDMNRFWNSLSDVSAHMETMSHRTTMLESAVAMTTHFNTIHKNISDYRDDVNSEVPDTVRQINVLLDEISQLNAGIVSTECGGMSNVGANDLRDTRGEKLRQLGELIDVDVTEEDNGSCIVSLNGRLMVYHDQVEKLATRQENIDGMQASVPVFERDSYPIDNAGGKLGALVDIRDEVLPGYLEELDQLAGVYTWEFNRAYSQLQGGESFDALTAKNGPVDPSVTLDKLQFKDDAPEGTFTIENGILEVLVHNRKTGETSTARVEIDVDGRPGPSGEPDMILWDPENPGASNSFINRLQKELDAKAPGQFKVDIDNDYKVSITSQSDDYGFTFGSDPSGILAVLGMNVLFTGHGAADIGVNEDLSKNPELLATSHSVQGGDNSGINELVTMLAKPVERLGGITADEYYRGITGRLGGEALRATNTYSLNADLVTRAFTQRESISGVNEDEEVVKLITYQRAYQSAARYISVVEECYDALLNM